MRSIRNTISVLVCVSFFIFFGSAQAQLDQSSLPKWKFDAVGVSAEMFKQTNSNLDFEQIRNIATSPKDLPGDMSEYRQSYADANIGEMVSAFGRC